MAEYIEREAMKAEIMKHYSSEYPAALVLAIIDNQPAADVAEVMHGKWVRMEDDIIYWYACSECKVNIPKTEYGNDYWSDYCPRCGAIMDFGGDEE